MRAYICDQCQKHEESGPQNDLQPRGWYTIGQYDAPPYNQHVCGTGCLVAWAQDRFLAEHPPEPVPEPMPKAEPIHDTF